jgi:hypothetical protein
MRKVVSLLVLLVVSLVPAGLVTAAASPSSAVAPAARVAFAPLVPPPAVELPGSASAAHVTPAKRKVSATTKHHGVYHCEMHPLQMGTVDTDVQVCDWR